MKRFLVIVFCLFFYSTFAWAETFTSRQLLSDDETFTVDSGDTYYYDGNKVIDAVGHSNVTVINNGNIIAHQQESYPTELRACGSGCDDSIDASSSVNFTLTNNGTVWAGHNRTIDLRSATGDITVTNNVGGKIAAGERVNDYDVLDLDGAGSSGDTITIVNHGTIENTARNWDLIGMSDLDNGAIINFTNTGTIRQGTETFGSGNTYWGIVQAYDSTDEINFNNSGTMQSSRRIFMLDGTTNFTITNSGTIKQDNFAYHGRTDGQAPNAYDYTTIQVGTTGSGATIKNSGTISAFAQNNHAITIGDNDANEAHSNATIENSGTISAGSDDYARAIIIIPSASGTITSGTTIKVKEEAEFTGGIDLGKTESTIVLDPSIKKDITITVYNYDGDLTITNNLTGNDTYTLTEEDLDSDGTADDGTLTILGEDLEIAQDNPKYRSENVLTKLRGLFDAANYINWHFPEDKMFKIFHSTQKRDGTYKGEMSGILGQLDPFTWGPLRSNVFLGYTRQYGDFDNGEFLGGDNFALGLKNVYEKGGFKTSFTPMIGLNDLTVTDFDTDTKTSINTNLLSEFAAINNKFGKKIELSEKGFVNLSVQSTLGLQRFPEYLAKFTDGDLSVDEAVERVLGVGFEIKYSNDVGQGFVIQPYVGFNTSNNFNDTIKVTADGENKNVSPAASWTSGYYTGVSLTKETKGIDFDLDLMYGNEDGLINQIAAFSLTKSFGEVKTQPRMPDIKELKKKHDLPKVDESLTTQDYKKDLRKSDTKIKKLKLLAEKVFQENQISKHLVKELLKENEKIKLSKEIFKKKLLELERENEALLRSIEEAKKSESNKFILLYFLAIYITTVLLLTSLIASLYNKIRYGSSRQTI